MTEDEVVQRRKRSDDRVTEMLEAVQARSGAEVASLGAMCVGMVDDLIMMFVAASTAKVMQKPEMRELLVRKFNSTVSSVITLLCERAYKKDDRGNPVDPKEASMVRESIRGVVMLRIEDALAALKLDFEVKR